MKIAQQFVPRLCGLTRALRFTTAVLVTLFFFESISLADQQKIVLLTSIDTKGVKSFFWKAYYRDYVQSLEETFRKNFADSRYVIEIVHDADQFDLWTVLHDPRNVGVFWMSHAGALDDSTTSDGLINTHKIIDSRGYEVTPVFEKIHPNLRFLAVIGCFSKKVMDTLPNVSHDPKHPDHPFLRLFTFNDKVNAKTGLKLAIGESKKVLEIPEIRYGYTSTCKPVSGYRVYASRTFQTDRSVVTDGGPLIQPAARIMAGQVVLGVFPKGRSDGSETLMQSGEVFLPKATPTLPALRLDVGENIQVEFNKPILKNLDIGKLGLALTGEDRLNIEPWTLWSSSDGKPIGVFSHGYKVHDDHLQGVDLSTYITEQAEFQCDPMPSYD